MAFLSSQCCWLHSLKVTPARSVPWDIVARDVFFVNPKWLLMMVAQLSQTDCASGHRH